jgi:6-phosphofructokinase 2
MQSVITITMNPAIDLSTSVDEVTPVHKLRCAKANRDPGGGGINVARVITRLGGNVTAIYPTGGAAGQLLRRLVDAERIRSLTFEVADETRLSFVVSENKSGDEYRFVLPGPTLSDAEWHRCILDLQRLPISNGYLVMSGSLPTGVPADFFASVARMAKERGLLPVLDTSGPALAAALREGVHLMKPNHRELQELTGLPLEDETSRLAVCRDLVARGQAQVIALTLGHEGALLVTRGAAWRAHALAIKPVSTVGAGDSFLGAMTWALAGGHDLEDAFRYGIAAGSAALITPGTGLCRQNDVVRLHGQVSIEMI